MFGYIHVEGGIMITSLKDNNVRSIIIPEFIDGYEVIRINEYLLTWSPPNITVNGFNSNGFSIISNRFIKYDNLIFELISNIGNDYIVKGGLSEILYYIIDDKRKLSNFNEKW